MLPRFPENPLLRAHPSSVPSDSFPRTVYTTVSEEIKWFQTYKVAEKHKIFKKEIVQGCDSSVGTSVLVMVRCSGQKVRTVSIAVHLQTGDC